MARDEDTREVRALVRQLEDGLRQTIDELLELDDDELQEACGHNCARGGTVWDLLTHNIEHERAHAGQVIGARDDLRLLQQSPLVRLVADFYVARAHLIATLFGLPDAALDREPQPGQWGVKQIVEHVLHWDRDSIDHLAAEHRDRVSRRTSTREGAEGA
jgi:uncharacterized damage-inducible protein DinB